ncbi:MAG: family 43 glycosylhydrolase [Ignavibacteria bacterium]
MRLLWMLVYCLIIYFQNIYGQSVAFATYMNPVIPGDHPDPTLTRIGDDFYTSGSSFNPTPKIYHSTDLVHWEVISQPVSASWSGYGDSPGGGIWGGHMVFYNGIYWHFFGRGGGNMYFVKADKPEGPWSTPTQIHVPSGMSGLGVDNSIFIDEEIGKWYLLTKNGRENNHIVELGEDGQPTGIVLDLTWLNPDSEGNPYGWAEGPVMWKYNGYYYYSFAQHLAGSQYVMRSDTLTDEKSTWTIVGSNIFTGSKGVYRSPNHISPAVLLDDSKSWVITHSYNSDYYAQGRQGLLCEVTYDDEGFPNIQRPSDTAVSAPDLPSSGIPWMVPHSDLFNSEKLNPEWSFLGYTSTDTYSLSERPGWLKLSISGRGGKNTIIKNDGEHNYSLITRIDFEPKTTTTEAGLRIINGPETHQAKVFSSMNTDGQKILAFSFEDTRYEVENTIGSIVWLKLTRNEHRVYGYYSSDGFTWTQIGEYINAAAIDVEQTQFNNFTGNQQGLYVINSTAYFDLYIYRDAYTPILTADPANQYGTTLLNNRYPPNSLTDIHNDDWVLYAGVEFGIDDYEKQPDSVSITASCNSSGGIIEVLLDSLTGTKTAELQISNTGDWDEYKTFTTDISEEVSGNHDVYLRFKGSSADELFRLQTITFIEIDDAPTSVGDINENIIPNDFKLEQNYPNPFNPTTKIRYSVGKASKVTLKVFDILGRDIETLVNKVNSTGEHTVEFNGNNLSSGIYFYQIRANEFIETKKFILQK